MQQTKSEPLRDAYLALASMEHRITELRQHMARLSAHMLAYPALYVTGALPRWVEDMFRLIEQAEKLQKEETK